MITREGSKIREIAPTTYEVKLERIVRIIAVEFQNNPTLADCDPISILACIMEATGHGLEIGKLLGQAFLIPRWDKKRNCQRANLQIGYKGWEELAYRGGSIRLIEPVVVFAEDDFEYWDENGTIHFIHVPNLDAETVEPRLAYLKTYLKGETEPIRYVMPKRDIIKRMEAGDNYKRASEGSKKTPWDEWTEEMWKKTVVIAGLKHISKSSEVARMITLTERLYAGIDQDLAQEHGLTGTPPKAALPRVQAPAALPPATARPQSPPQQGGEPGTTIGQDDQGGPPVQEEASGPQDGPEGQQAEGAGEPTEPAGPPSGPANDAAAREWDQMTEYQDRLFASDATPESIAAVEVEFPQFITNPDYIGDLRGWIEQAKARFRPNARRRPTNG